MGNSGKGYIEIIRYVAYRWPVIFIQYCFTLAKTNFSKTAKRVSLDKALNAADIRSIFCRGSFCLIFPASNLSFWFNLDVYIFI